MLFGDESLYSYAIFPVRVLIDRVIVFIVDDGIDSVLLSAEDGSGPIDKVYILRAALTDRVSVYLTDRFECDIGFKRLLDFYGILSKLIKSRDKKLLPVQF